MTDTSNRVRRSQNGEDLFVLDYFDGYVGNLLSIGENDGETFSNAKLLIDNGWKAVLVEPGETYSKLFLLYNDNEKVKTCNYGIGTKFEKVKFWESGAHVPDGTDRGLVSTTDFEETKRWPDVEFKEREINLVPFDRVQRYAPFDFISIDAEGRDWAILKQIDLEAVGCRCLCIEHNSDRSLLEKFVEYCKGYRIGLVNAENILFIKP